MYLHLDVVFRFMLPHFETKVQDFCTPPSPQPQLVKNFRFTEFQENPVKVFLLKRFCTKKKKKLNFPQHFHSPCRELRCAFPTRDIPSFHTSAGSLNARRAKGTVSHCLPLICVRHCCLKIKIKNTFTTQKDQTFERSTTTETVLSPHNHKIVGSAVRSNEGLHGENLPYQQVEPFQSAGFQFTFK